MSGIAERVEVSVRAERRRRWSAEEKLRIVRETLAPGAVAQAVADRHGIGTGLLYTWRKQMLATAMAGFVPVRIVAETEDPVLPLPAPEPDPAPRPAPASTATPLDGLIEVELPGGARVLVGPGADLALLRGVLEALGRR